MMLLNSLLALYALSALLDILTTWRALRDGGHEAWPPMAWLMERIGSRPALLVKLVPVAIAWLMVDREPWLPWLVESLAFSFSVQLAVALHNLYLLES